MVDAGLLGLLEAGQVGVDDLAVALEAEDQRDVDARADRDRRGDGLEALDRRRDLDHDVRLLDALPEALRLVDGRLGVVRCGGRDLDRDAAVEAVARVVDRAEDVGRLADVRRRDLEHGAVDVCAVGGELAHLLVVRLALGQGAREDRGVRRDAHDVLLLDQLLEAARVDALAGQVVEPDAHAERGQLGGGGGCGVSHVLLSPSCRLSSSARVAL
jgi:hypothetical protein